MTSNHLDVAQEESTCSGCTGPLVRFQSSRLQIEARARSSTATAPRWNVELLTPTAEVRVLSVVRLPPLHGRNTMLRTSLTGVRLLSVARRLATGPWGQATCRSLGRGSIPLGGRPIFTCVRFRSSVHWGQAMQVALEVRLLEGCHGPHTIARERFDSSRRRCARRDLSGCSSAAEHVAHSYKVTGAIPVAQTNDSWM